ncbi:AAC(3) family N-acetyltransferase [Marinimicrobium agarilyticum]|uniref:AAC(3) family N-acetyltransferase n=1 Tax=Marinimicrobium agarilyticum TaxID=306546 RepID=UPI000413E742|nr:AAC(3) family N-acetyltransferase [Marinimicrobium agarilyticum]
MNINPHLELSNLLKDLGVKPGDTLMVHASLRSLGEAMPADIVIAGLRRALGTGGTLAMPTLSYEAVDADNPMFDTEDTPSCVGSLSEVFRRQQGVVRSLHPTHSAAAIGPKTSELLVGHENDHTPCGEHSPFARLPSLGGRILFLGCDMSVNTSMHALEEQVMPPYLLQDEPVDFILTDGRGRQVTSSVRCHNFEGYRQRYDRLESLLPPEAIKRGQLLAADCMLVDAQAAWDAGLSALKQDPLYFVDKV